jgi:hypothetical protein
MILGQTKLASVPKRYTLKPLFKPETCTSSPPNAEMVSNSAPLNVSVAPVYIEFCSCIIGRIRFGQYFWNRFLAVVIIDRDN